MKKETQNLLGAIVLLTLAATSNYWYDGLSFDPPFFVLNLISVVASQLPCTQMLMSLLFDVSIFAAGTALFASQNYEKQAKKLSILQSGVESFEVFNESVADFSGSSARQYS